MKNKIQNSVSVLMLLFLLSSSANAQMLLGSDAVGRVYLSNLNISIGIPTSMQSQLVRQDFENESIFNLKDGNNSPVFLFSVSKVTGVQWMQIKDQVKDYTIIENKDEFITFVQKTDVRKIKGAANDQYQSAIQQLDGMIASIHFN